MPCLMGQEYIAQAGQLLVGFEPAEARGCLLHGNRDRKLLKVFVRGHQQGMHPMLISGRRVLTAMGAKPRVTRVASAGREEASLAARAGNSRSPNRTIFGRTVIRRAILRAD